MGTATDEMKNGIFFSDNINDFIADHSDKFLPDRLTEHIEKIIAKKQLVKADIARASGLDRTYAYHIMNGQKCPSRDKLIALAFGMGLSVDETDELLKVSRNMPLYSRDIRDSAIIFSIRHKNSIIELNQLLFDMGLDPIV